MSGVCLAPAADFKESAATGDPTRASAFKGERLLAARIDDIVESLQRKWPDLHSVSSRA